MLTHSKEAPAFYSYDPETGEFIDTGTCDLSPARYPRGHEKAGHLMEPDVPLLPGCATLEPPPPVGDNEASVWNGKAWKIVPCYRGEVRWHDKQFVAITGLGEPPAPPITIHDAQYVLVPGAEEDQTTIRVWINDDVIDILDQPGLPREVLAAWEAKGETIRPVDSLTLDKPSTEA